jgi:hypothetical protein
MNGISTLKRLAKARLDEESAKLASLRDIADQLRQQQQTLHQRLDDESAIADPDILRETLLYRGTFLRGMLAEIDRLNEKIAKAEAEAASQEEVVREIFAEMKTYESVETARIEAEAARRNKLEQEETEDITQMRWHHDAS